MVVGGERYELRAIIKHRGGVSGTSGHYIAYGKRELDGAKLWFEFDDAEVT